MLETNSCFSKVYFDSYLIDAYLSKQVNDSFGREIKRHSQIVCLSQLCYNQTGAMILVSGLALSYQQHLN